MLNPTRLADRVQLVAFAVGRDRHAIERDRDPGLEDEIEMRGRLRRARRIAGAPDQ